MALPDPDDVNIGQQDTSDIIPATGLIYAPTSGMPYNRGPRPRALLMGWTPDPDNPGYGTIHVVFRDAGGRVYDYYNVEQSIWIGMRDCWSVGEYLEASGLNTWPTKGFSGSAEAIKYQKVVAARRKEFGKEYAGTKEFLGAPKKLLGNTPEE